jgi:hypothetical protein
MHYYKDFRHHGNLAFVNFKAYLFILVKLGDYSSDCVVFSDSNSLSLYFMGEEDLNILRSTVVTKLFGQ